MRGMHIHFRKMWPAIDQADQRCSDWRVVTGQRDEEALLRAGEFEIGKRRGGVRPFAGQIDCRKQRCRGELDARHSCNVARRCWLNHVANRATQARQLRRCLG